MQVIDHRLSDEDLDIEQIGLRKGTKRDETKITTLVIRGTGTPSAISARNAYTSGQNLAHLILGRDGSTIIQTTDFNRRVGAGFRFETTAIIIGLVNVGYLVEFESQRSHYRHKDNYPPQDHLFARAINDRKQRLWTRFPDDQLNLLLGVIEALMKKYKNLRVVQSYDELRTNALQPGPTFPMLNFIERLRHKVPNLVNKKMVTRKTTQPILLLNAPLISSDAFRDNPTPVSSKSVTKNKAVSVVEESGSWSLVEVIGEPDEPWLKGWLPAREVAFTEFKARVIEDPFLGDMLETEDHAAFPFIPAGKGNFNTRKDSNHPKYLVMHLTTGTQLQSTINHFRNAGSGVSTHLVIGRDGRVIQMVPFNHAAYHAGSGSWEGDSKLNYLSIGIELDNAGRVKQDKNGNWVKRKHIIPANRVIKARHKNDPIDRHYEGYTEAQLKAAQCVARALVNKYQLKDIIGHDDISPDRRYDPGPLFPMEDWREDLIGQKEPKIKKYKTNTDSVIYKDYEGRPPQIPHPLITNIRLKNNRIIKLFDKTRSNEYWLIKVKKGSRPPVIGWVKKDLIKPINDKYKIFSEKRVAFYRRLPNGAPPPTQLKRGSKEFLLPEDTEVQILNEENGMARVVTLKPIGKLRVTGWVNRDDLGPAT
jgi:N-acetylmuramoyl-L-alanine amidase